MKTQPSADQPDPADEFRRRFGRPPLLSASAPGRVNLIGEHTDYNDGFVLPMPIPQETSVQLALRDDDEVHVASAAVRDGAARRYRLGAEARTRTWIDYVQGVTAAVRSALAARRDAEGLRLRGFDLFVTSRVPMGSGLSSSAALEIALLRALRRAFDLPFDDLDLARLGRRAENELVGAPVGIMDQLASSLGRPREALFVDTRSLETRSVPFPPSVDLAVVDSGQRHHHGGGEYATRRSECERAAAALALPALRDCSADGDAASAALLRALPAPLGRRARHVVTENGRVLAAVRALQGGDMPALGALLSASHASMRDDFEISTPEIDALVELASAEPGVLGARLTGGGFGGAVIVLTPRDRGREIADRVAARYADRTGLTPTVLLP